MSRITRTRSKRYVGICDHDGCAWMTDVISTRLRCGQLLREHQRTVHGTVGTIGRTPMRQPEGIPEAEMISLGDHQDELVVLSHPIPNQTLQTSYGVREVTNAYLSWWADNAWHESGSRIPVFFAAVQRQMKKDLAEPVGGVLRNDGKKWYLEATKDKDLVAALNEWVDPEAPF